MHKRKLSSLFSDVYSFVRPERLLQLGSFRRLYIFTYFQYKRFLEDPFHALAQRQPQLFHNGDILDVGANIGYTACIFARAMTTGSRVYAFEPDRFTYSLLREVVMQNGPPGGIRTINSAVGNFDGEVEFWHNKKHPADHRVVTEQFRKIEKMDTELSAIPLTTVDTFVSNSDLRSLSFVKIDVQGYELAVCQGMTKTLERFPDLYVCVEYCPTAMTELGFEPDDLLNFFERRGFRIYALGSGSLKSLNGQESMRELLRHVDYVDLLFSKRDLISAS